MTAPHAGCIGLRTVGLSTAVCIDWQLGGHRTVRGAVHAPAARTLPLSTNQVSFRLERTVFTKLRREKSQRCTCGRPGVTYGAGTNRVAHTKLRHNQRHVQA